MPRDGHFGPPIGYLNPRSRDDRRFDNRPVEPGKVRDTYIEQGNDVPASHPNAARRCCGTGGRYTPSLMSAQRRDLYQILGVATDATPPVIRAAFLAKARDLHPDRADDAHRAAAESAFRELSDAYETLSDPARRSDYDVRRRLTQIWQPPDKPASTWGRAHEQVILRWGLERMPWYGWLIVGPAMLGVAAVIGAQFFFYYVFVYGTLVLIPLVVIWYAWHLWFPLGVLMLLPTMWLWGFLIQGTYRNWRRDKQDRTGPQYRHSI